MSTMLLHTRGLSGSGTACPGDGHSRDRLRPPDPSKHHDSNHFQAVRGRGTTFGSGL